MKKFLFTIALMGALVVLVDPARNLVGEILKLEDPTTSEIEKGDWLSKVALRHYGDASYWRELALVNRAPDADLIFPDEEIIVPSFKAIQKIRDAQRLSTVNTLVDEQEAIVAARTESQTEEIAARPESQNESQSGSEEGEQLQGDPSKDIGDEVIAANPQDSDLLSGETESAANGQETGTFRASTPVIAGLVILSVIAVIAVFMAIRSRRRHQRIASAEREDEYDIWQNRESPYKYRDAGDQEGKGSKKEKMKDVELVK